jgi:CBS domain-containing protein
MKLIKNEEEWYARPMLVKESMTRLPRTVAPEVPLRDAKTYMERYEVRHLPVLEKGELVGAISDSDIRTAETFHSRCYQSVADAMDSSPYVVSPDTPLGEVLSEMIDRKLDCALIVNPSGIVIGIFTAHDALRMLYGLVMLGQREHRDDRKAA